MIKEIKASKEEKKRLIELLDNSRVICDLTFMNAMFDGMNKLLYYSELKEKGHEWTEIKTIYELHFEIKDYNPFKSYDDEIPFDEKQKIIELIKKSDIINLVYVAEDTVLNSSHSYFSKEIESEKWSNFEHRILAVQFDFIPMEKVNGNNEERNKMINGEKYRDEILEISKTGRTFGVTEDNYPVSCRDLLCSSCIFDGEDEAYRYCEYPRMEWLLSEYKETKTITESEKRFCNMLINLYVVFSGNVVEECNLCLERENDGNLFLDGDVAHTGGNEIGYMIDELKFDTIKIGETYKLIDLLKLPVKK